MKNFSWILTVVVLLLTACHSKDERGKKDYSGWTAYAGSKEGIRYSSNTEIDTANVSRLQIAWRYSTHDLDTSNRTQNQCNPIIVDGILYGISPRLKLFALNASNGEQQWLFDPALEDTASKNDPFAFFKVSRGVLYWSDGDDKRIYYSVGARTYAISTRDGKPVRTFGKNGFIDLSQNLDRDESATPFVGNSTPGVIYKDLLIIGTRVSESADAAPGHIRAYDIRTGERKWIFHTIPHPGEFGYDTWPDKEAYKKFGGANSWSGMSLDEDKGIVYVPTGSIGDDFYGGIRKGTGLFANSLIALDAATGKYLWHFQVIHHDLWDRDLPANPNLVTIHHDDKDIDAVAQITKHGYVFLFDRSTGKPVFSIEEKAVPTGDALPGEAPWPTQPIPTLPAPFARQQFAPEDVTNLDSATHADMLEKYNKIKYRTMFSPPSKQGSWIFPGFDGGGEWGGAAVDPVTAILYVNSSELPWALTMIEVPANQKDFSIKGMGAVVYGQHCIACHGAELKGNGSSYPSLVHLEKKYTDDQVLQIVANGKNMMPAFKQLDDNEKTALLAFVMNKENKEATTKSPVKSKVADTVANKSVAALQPKKSILDEVPYTMTGYNRFYDKNGYPGITPPWGTLNAVDLNSGKLLWKVPLGEYPELTKRGIPVTGTENYGGPVVTKGGLIFIAASRDAKIRAFDKVSGKVLWEAQLPVPGYATPAVYNVDGKEFVVIACGGGKIGSKSGDEYIAFALPEKK